MSLVPQTPRSHGPEPAHPSWSDRSLTQEERRGRWGVQAAHFRARELAEDVFDGPVRTGLLGVRSTGPMRAILRIDVPFSGLDRHHELERRFLERAHLDPVLSRVPLVYVLGPSLG